jgi:integrase
MILTQCRMWNKLRTKHRYMKKDQLSEWYRAVKRLKSNSLRDWLLLILFTGLRKTEAAQMTWRNVDFADRSFVINDTKNGKDHSLPMSSFVYDLLWRRRRHTPRDVAWVFPNRFFNGPMSSDTCTYERVGFESGIRFGPHDLRRTFVLLARLVRADHYTIKQLLNHAGGSDITFSCYAVKDIETLREPIESIAQALKYYLGIDDKIVIEGITPVQISVMDDYLVDAEIVV